jgi:starch-binding outer membrane protein, SusD/RagB family
MKNKITKLLMAACLAFTIFSCKKNILDVKPTAFVSDATLWADLNLVDQFVNNIYGTLPSGFNRKDFGEGDGFEWSRGMSIMDAGTDDADGKLDAKVQLFNTADITPSFTPYNQDIWTFNYNAIRKCNVLLSRIDGVPGDAAIKSRYKGEALFIRAFCYADLIKTYGGVPLILTAQEITDDLLVPRNTYDECVTQIVKDCDEAAAILPTTYGAANLGRATKGAALSVKARTYLYKASPLNNPSNTLSHWQNAATAAKAVMDLNVYSLYPDYYNLFLDKANAEVIFARQFQKPQIASPISYTLGMSAGIGDGTWGGFAPTQNLVDAYEMNNGKPISDPSSGYDAQNPYLNRDSRLDKTVLHNGSSWKGVTIQTYEGGNANQSSNNDRSRTSYGLKKFLDQSLVTAAQVYLGQDNNWIFFRYADVLLMYAEAQNEAVGPDASVYSAIKLVRARSGQPDLPAGLTQSQMRDKIRNERRVELVFEEHRFWDVRRWKLGMTYFNGPVNRIKIIKTGSTLTHTVEVYENRTYKEFQNVFPIPQFERDKNPKLTQNTGY